ncbi:MAG TPA: penicillin acylase family protein [Ktedonobacteraceae bacterium]|nr:penicillin acylase family protein [Ktedonobacteraceae bacterium]
MQKLTVVKLMRIIKIIAPVLLVFVVLLNRMWMWMIVLVLIFLLTGMWLWLVRRTLPQTSGKLVLAGLEQSVFVTRDQWGVPSISATTLHDVAFAQGYITAQDRLFQMELNRRIAQGRLAEMFGAGPHNQVLESDIYLRTLGLSQLATAEWASVDPRSTLELQAYADGVNAFITAHQHKLPLEFTLLGVSMEPWQPVDSLAYGRVLALSLVGNWRLSYVRSLIETKLGTELTNHLFPAYPAENPSLLTATGNASPLISDAATPSSDTAQSIETERQSADTSWFSRLAHWLPDIAPRASFVRALLDPLTGGLGSNAWVVDGMRTVTGKPLLANDPHLGISMPAIWYQIALRGGGLDVVGFSLPGMPGVMIGQNTHIAWGISYAETDVTTLYRETLDPVAHPGQYYYAGCWLPLQTRHETIQIKKKAKPVVFTALSTRHGPLLNESVPDLKEYPPVTLKWTALEPTYTSTGFLELNFATDWQQFRAALHHISLNLNFVYADREGNIGYCMSGLVPLRSAESGLLPVEGSTGTHEWRGYLPQEEMPMLFNPPTHIIVTANNQIVPTDYPVYITRTWDPGYRARRISELLTATPRLTVADYQRIQADVYSIPAAIQTPYFIAAGQAAGGDAELAANLLRSWDYLLTSQSVSAAVYEVTAGTLLRETLEPLLGKKLYNTYSRIYFASWRMVLLNQLLSSPTAHFFGNGSNTSDNATEIFIRRDAAIAHAMSNAIDQLRAKFGADSTKWQWGALHQADFAHPLAKQVPLNLVFGLTPLQRPGDSVTINVGGSEGFALDPPSYDQITVASMRMIIDLASRDHSLWVMTTGQSGQPFSPHYRDQVSDWNTGIYQPMAFLEQAAAKEILVLKPLS